MLLPRAGRDEPPSLAGLSDAVQVIDFSVRIRSGEGWARSKWQ